MEQKKNLITISEIPLYSPSLGKKWQQIIRSWAKFIRDDNDLFVMVTGDVGTGKSNLVMGLCDWHICREFNIKYDYDSMMYLDNNPKELRRRWFDLPKFTPIQVDEAADNFLAVDWWKDDSTDMKRSAIKSRIGGKIVFLLIPEKRELQSFFRNSRVTFWIHIWKRGYCTIFAKSKNIFASNKWYEQEGEKDFRKARVKSVSQSLRVSSRHPCFMANVRYRKYDDKKWRRYQRDSALAKAREQSDENQLLTASLCFVRKNKLKQTKNFTKNA